MTTKLLKIEDICSRLQCGRSKAYYLIRSGVLPQPVKVGASARWPEPEIEAVIAGLIAQRDRVAGLR